MKTILLSEKEFNEMQCKLDAISSQLQNLNRQNPLSEKWLDNDEVCEVLKISKRTLQNYRDNGILPFSQISNKIYYKSSDIDKHLESNYIRFA